MNDAERVLLTNILGHIALAASGQQAAYTQLKMAEEKLQRMLGLTTTPGMQPVVGPPPTPPQQK